MPPTVSVILPALNEIAFIRDCLDSLAIQDYPSIVEILVVDGGSTDGTRSVVECFGPPVSLIENSRVTAAAAMNIGLAASRGEIIVRADSHALYARDYVTACVSVLEETGAANVGGRMRPVGTTSFGRAIAAVTSSPFGVGPGKFHYSERRQAVDTVYLGCWRRETLDAVGGWDEDRLQWAAEDQELNYRIRRAGGTVLLDGAIRSFYFPRETPRSLWRQYFNYGVAKASTLRKHRALPTLRPLGPAALVASAVLPCLLRRRNLALMAPMVHSLTTAWAGLSLGRAPGVAPHRAFVSLQICHWSYGLGFWCGIGRALLGRQFDNRPSGHR